MKRFSVVLVALLQVPLLGGACGTEERRPRRGTFVDDAAPRGSETPLRRWRHADAFGELDVVRERLKSSHFLGSPGAEVRVNAHAAWYGKGGPPLGEGSLIVVSHDTPDGTVRFAMEKRREIDVRDPTSLAWEYAVIDDASRVVEVGRIPTCVRCHEEAPADEVFGPPGL